MALEIERDKQMNGSSVVLLALILMTSTPQGFASSPTAEEALALPALIGMQLSVGKAASQGKVPNSVVTCVNQLPSDSFVPVFHALMEETLSSEEISSTEQFFQSAIGRKYAKHGVTQLYTAVGESPPESAPTFSDSEYAELERFSQTSAGEKLMLRKIMESEPARRAVSARIQELLASCRTK
jgi:hypothetical protein